MTIGGTIFLQVILILINAFFAGTEIAVISLNPIQLKKEAEDGDKKAIRLLKMSENQSSFLSTIQIGITLAGFLGAAFSADVLSEHLVDFILSLGIKASYDLLNTISVVLITIVISFFTLIFGELVPKRIAQQKAEGWARGAASFISGLAVFFKPFVALLTGCTNLLLKLLHLKTDSKEEEVTEEDIRLMVDASGESGSIEEDEKEWIQNVFDFNDIAVDEVMTRDADCLWIQADDSDEDILKTIEDSGFSRFPVFGEDHDDIIGVLFAREFLLNMTKEEGKKSLKDLLREPYLVPDSIHADKLFSDMQAKKIHFAIVIDEYGSTAGIITMEDLLEEIVGNIYDEFDGQEEQDIVSLSPTSWLVSGDTLITELNEKTGLDIKESEDYDTIGGLALSTLSSIPSDGTEFETELDGVKIYVKKIEDHRVISVEVEKLSTPPFVEQDHG